MTYNWRVDSYLSWLFWCRMMALLRGSQHFETLPEMYFIESRGGIP